VSRTEAVCRLPERHLDRRRRPRRRVRGPGVPGGGRPSDASRGYGRGRRSGRHPGRDERGRRADRGSGWGARPRTQGDDDGCPHHPGRHPGRRPPLAGPPTASRGLPRSPSVHALTLAAGGRSAEPPSPRCGRADAVVDNRGRSGMRGKAVGVRGVCCKRTSSW